jgi:hypothetical protein
MEGKMRKIVVSTIWVLVCLPAFRCFAGGPAELMKRYNTCVKEYEWVRARTLANTLIEGYEKAPHQNPFALDKNIDQIRLRVKCGLTFDDKIDNEELAKSNMPKIIEMSLKYRPYKIPEVDFVKAKDLGKLEKIYKRYVNTYNTFQQEMDSLRKKNLNSREDDALTYERNILQSVREDTKYGYEKRKCYIEQQEAIKGMQKLVEENKATAQTLYDFYVDPFVRLGKIFFK